MPRETTFGPGFQAHAAPEAILARLELRRRQAARLRTEITRLERLLVQRSRQVLDGAWPPDPATCCDGSHYDPPAGAPATDRQETPR